MKFNSFRSRAAACLVALLTSALFIGQANAQPGAPQMSPERKAQVERELTPRGEKIGLLLVFHGAPGPNWANLTGSIVDKVAKINAEKKVFAAVDGCDMEFNFENDVVEGFSRLEKQGCDAVVVSPVFIYPTSHVQFDVVTILGLYGDPQAREAAREEGARIVKTKLPIALTPTLSAGDLLKDFVVAEAKATMKNPKNERLLVIAHGDEGYAGLVDSLTQDALDAAGELGFDSVQSVFCEMGQTFGKKVKPVVEKNTKDGKKTVIVAIYLASSAKSFVERIQKFAKQEGDDSASLEGLDYVCSEGRIGEFEETPQFIYDLAVEASKH